jgi:hypothetical protein
MADERDEKDLTGDLAIDDESAKEVSGGGASEMADGQARHGAADFVDQFTSPRRFKSRRFKSHWFKHR